ncbi:hypothetical protein JKY72_02765 [Candidatus Gracilibacteria bacterium]|nr:hypothetical protein [Candidatus Gracilibacteria bacterium]
MNQRPSQKLQKSFAGDKNILRVSALFMFLLAFILLSIEWNLNAQGWNVLVPILGWLALVKGLVWFWSPGWVKKMWGDFFKNDNMVVFWALLTTGLGVGVIYVAMNLL